MFFNESIWKYFSLLFRPLASEVLGYIDTYNKMVGKPLIENSVATDVKRVQSILPTRIGIFPAKDWSTCFQIGSNFLQCPHQGA